MSAVCEVGASESLSYVEIRTSESLDQIFPELRWLREGEVTVTQEGVCTRNPKTIEYDRTLLTIKCLDLIIQGGSEAYQEFVKAQKVDPLTREAFDSLHQKNSYFQEKFHLTPDRLQLLLRSALVMGDLGKTEKAREIFPKITTPDHDDFEKEALCILRDSPSLCPTFEQLNPREQEILIQATGLIHFGHVYHLEGGHEMFSHLKKAAPDEAILEFALFVQRCDVAGALGHRNSDASVTFTQTTFEMYEAVGKACKVLLDPSKNPGDAYQTFVDLRAQKVGLDPRTSEGHILTRIAAMLRVFTPEAMAPYQSAYDKLPAEEKDLLNKWFCNDTPPEETLTPTYVPAVLLNLVGNLGVEKGIQLGLPVIAKALEAFHSNRPADLRACFNPLAGQAKNPHAESLFQKGIIAIDPSNGNITLKEPLPEESALVC